MKQQWKDIERLERKYDSFHLHKGVKEITHTYKRKTPTKVIGDDKLIGEQKN